MFYISPPKEEGDSDPVFLILNLATENHLRRLICSQYGMRVPSTVSGKPSITAKGIGWDPHGQ